MRTSANILLYFQFVEVDPLHDEMLRKKEEQDREKPYRHLFRFPHMGMWTKLRPGIWNFLEKVNVVLMIIIILTVNTLHFFLKIIYFPF